ncbi:MAG: hypothetical protein DMF92_15210 [Acidobacteria bacterium]|nr:MAG: hypothetical protein DMF92_15210 [Acidobacteriota bacterium]
MSAQSPFCADTTAGVAHLRANDSVPGSIVRRLQRFEHRFDAGGALFIIVAVHAHSRPFRLVLRLSFTVIGFPSRPKFSKVFF